MCDDFRPLEEDALDEDFAGMMVMAEDKGDASKAKDGGLGDWFKQNGWPVVCAVIVVAGNFYVIDYKVDDLKKSVDENIKSINEMKVSLAEGKVERKGISDDLSDVKAKSTMLFKLTADMERIKVSVDANRMIFNRDLERVREESSSAKRAWGELDAKAREHSKAIDSLTSDMRRVDFKSLSEAIRAMNGVRAELVLIEGRLKAVEATLNRHVESLAALSRDVQVAKGAATEAGSVASSIERRLRDIDARLKVAEGKLVAIAKTRRSEQ